MDKEHFPRTQILPDGRQIVIANELCNCTHFRTQHDGLWGAGQCMEITCSCGQFLWKCLVLGGMSDTQDKWIAHIEPTAEGAIRGMQEELEEKDNEIERLQEEKQVVEKDLELAEKRTTEHFLKEAELEKKLEHITKKYLVNEEQLMRFMFPYKRITLAKIKSIIVEDRVDYL